MVGPVSLSAWMKSSRWFTTRKGKQCCPNHIQVMKTPSLQGPPEFSFLRKVESRVQPKVEGASSCEPVAYGIDPVLARKVIKEARWAYFNNRLLIH